MCILDISDYHFCRFRIFWNIMLCFWLGASRNFEGPQCLHIQDQAVHPTGIEFSPPSLLILNQNLTNFLVAFNHNPRHPDSTITDTQPSAHYSWVFLFVTSYVIVFVHFPFKVCKFLVDVSCEVGVRE